MKRLIVFLLFKSFAIFCEGSEKPNIFDCANASDVTRSGVCAVESNWCCQSYAGNECGGQTNQGSTGYAPPVEFFPNSVMIDYRPSHPTLFCVKGIKVSNSRRSSNIQGLLFQLNILQSSSGSSPRNLLSTTEAKLFPATVTTTGFEKGLFCLEVDLPDHELASETSSFNLQVSSLPANPNHLPVSYSDFSTTSRNGNWICDATNVDIYLTNCFTWGETILDDNFCATTNPENGKKCSNCVSKIVINFIILSFIVIGFAAVMTRLLLRKKTLSENTDEYLTSSDQNKMKYEQNSHHPDFGNQRSQRGEKTQVQKEANFFPPRPSQKFKLMGTETMV